MSAESLGHEKPHMFSGVRKWANNLQNNISHSQHHHDAVQKTQNVVNGLPEEAEGEAKVKTKILSYWTNLKYEWTGKMKTNFAKDSPVFLLGRCYHRKNDALDDPQSIARSEESMDEGEGIEGFRLDFHSRIWFTYRKEFPILNGSNLTSDCGWGCMLRSGQMLLAQSLVCHLLKRDWRWRENRNPPREEAVHRKIIKWFDDNPSYASPFSIHTLVDLGQESGKKAGDWYGPGSVAHLLRMALKKVGESYNELRDIGIYVAQDCAVYKQDILDEFQRQNDGFTKEEAWKSVVILVPVRLGVEKMNSIYAECLTSLFVLKSFLGIIGGRPRHSLYFVGFQDDRLIHLDPHYCQEKVDTFKENFPLSSFHCRSPRKMPISKMDPSCCLGFYCRTKAEFDEFVKEAPRSLTPKNQKYDYPIFVFCDGRRQDAMNFSLPPIPDDDDNIVVSVDGDDYLENEDFAFL